MTSELGEVAVGSMVASAETEPKLTLLASTSMPSVGNPSGEETNTNSVRPPPPKEGFLTVLSDPINYHVKHPLQYHWTLHQKIGPVEGSSSRGVSEKNWDKALRKSVTIGTVEDFWCIYNSMQDVTTIPENCDYFFMRQGVEPKWEDPANKNGCEVRFPLLRSMDFMNMWKMALISVVGCQYTDYHIITGVQFAFRPGKSRICLWMGECTLEVRERAKTEFTAAMEKAAGATPGTLHVDINMFQRHDGGDRRGSGGGGGDHRRGSDRGGAEGDRRGGGSGGWSRSGAGTSDGGSGGGAGGASGRGMGGRGGGRPYRPGGNENSSDRRRF